MKTFPVLLLAAVGSLMGPLVSAQDFAWEKTLSPQEILNEMIASGKYRPKQVASVETFEMPLVIDGRESGTVKVNAGTPLNLVSVRADGVTVELHGNEIKLAVEKTDLIARYADRRKEVDAMIEEQRLAMIEEGKGEFVLPPPPVQQVAADQPQNVTKIVYVDTSEPRIRVNSGNYWPYTPYYNYPYYYPNYIVPSRQVIIVNPPYCPPVKTATPVTNPPWGYQPVTGGAIPVKTPVATPVSRPVTPVVHPYAPARP